MTRILEPELLDGLPSTDPRAVHSRQDLRRLNKLMGNAAPIVAFVKNFARAVENREQIIIAEIGAGEGFVAAEVARKLSLQGIAGKLLLVDRRPSFAARVVNWEAHCIKADIFEWLQNASRVDVVIANLFLHHFTEDQLRAMLSRCGELCDCFAASEPRRSDMAQWFSRRVKLIGCNEVTRHDAEISVRAGFDGCELSALWPAGKEWRVEERRAGMFTHFFAAERVT